MTPELWEIVIDELRDGKSIAKISKMDKMPTQRVIYRYAFSTPEITAQYRESRVFGFETRMDVLHDIIDEPVDYSTSNQEMQRRKIKIDLMRWEASKLIPHIYGDKMSIKHANDPDNPIINKIELIITDVPKRPTE